MASIHLTKDDLMAIIIALPEKNNHLRDRLRREYDAIIREETRQIFNDGAEKIRAQSEELRTTLSQCGFLVSWVGICRKPVVTNGRCEDHWKRRKCWKYGCEALTVRDCSATMTLGVCGVAYCADHKHETQH